MTEVPTAGSAAGGLLDRLNNGLAWLVVANGASYLTSLLRERFLYQHEYGTHSLDVVVVALAVSAILGNALGVLLSFWWAAGRLAVRSVHLGLVVAAAASALVAVVSVESALLFVYVVASAAFLLATQRAAGMGRQLYALIAAATSPGAAVLIWATIGVRSVTNILLGYAAGAIWQAVGAWLVGRGGQIAPSGSTSSLLWPLVYIAAVQIDGVADISLLLLAGRGWASAGGFAYNTFGGITVLLIGPLSAQALAGRFHLERPIRILGVSTLVAGAFAALLPFVLRLVIHGGAVVGGGYHRVLVLSLLYAPAVPFAIFWQLMTRSEHRDAERWRALAIQASILFLVHLALLMLVVILRAWIYVPLSTVGAFAALAIARLVDSGRNAAQQATSPVVRREALG